MKSKEKRAPCGRPYKKKYSCVNKNDDNKPLVHNIKCHYCGRFGHTTLIVTLGRLKFLTRLWCGCRKVLII